MAKLVFANDSVGEEAVRLTFVNSAESLAARNP
jgi:hypothetical protein